MNILNITAQKPHSTGSGVYLTEIVKEFDTMGFSQSVIGGVYKEDVVTFPDKVEFIPVYFQSTELPFPIVGMSDEMPYESTLYNQMTKQMIKKFAQVFMSVIEKTVETFRPDLILCHHLYLLTAIVRERFPDLQVAAICHGTDIRQMKKHMLADSYIKEQMKKLNKIFALHEIQKLEIERIYEVDESRIKIIGSGYNPEIFRRQEIQKNRHEINLIYAGKLTQKKGVISLIQALDYIKDFEPPIVLNLAGGYGNEEEYNQIYRLAGKAAYKIKFLGKLNQAQLAQEFNRCDVFILPSFYEGLPLVLMEALACGLKVITTDLPGIREWMDCNIPNNAIIYVTPPPIENADEPKLESLPQFEESLARAIIEAVNQNTNHLADLQNASWESVCKKIIITENCNE
ncbi:MAG: glycosyltransferase family 4 protein [Lachnospiraceae bacterium]